MQINGSLRLALLSVFLSAIGGCSISPARLAKAQQLTDQLTDRTLSCHQADACAQASPYQGLAERLLRDAPSDSALPHAVNLLDVGETSLALRVHLIRSARSSIEIQSFIFANDDVGIFTLAELLSAARRGVRVRVLVDQLYSIDNRGLLAQLARAHVNFELRVFNPTFDDAATQPLEFAAGIICCFLKFNQRAHNKLLLIDQRIAIVGGRNIEDRYFDLDGDFNYRDRDVLVVGGEGRRMRQSFDQFWSHPRSRPLFALRDVASRIINAGLSPPTVVAQTLQHSDHIALASQRADDPEFIRSEFFQHRLEVPRLSYFSDPPSKGRGRATAARVNVSQEVSALISDADKEVVMQTPYLILSDPGRRAFRKLRADHPDLRVIVSTNSLAATDAFPVYAISHKHRRLHLQKLGFEIYEYKPYEGRSSLVFRKHDKMGLIGSARALGTRSALPLKKDGPRRGLHAKSIVVDQNISLIGSHNFDPRSHRFNTENGVVIWGNAFATALRDSILADTGPDQSWVVARKPDRGILTPINQAIESVSEKIPFFDIWLWRYATSYELRPECAPLRASDPRFQSCYVRVGDFPEVNLSAKSIYTRIITAFGGGLTPIL